MQPTKSVFQKVMDKATDIALALGYQLSKVFAIKYINIKMELTQDSHIHFHQTCDLVHVCM